MLNNGKSQMSLTVSWGDCDPANIVFYPNYFAWFNEAIEHHFAVVGLPKQEFIRRFNIVGFPMLDTRAKFHAPSTHGDVLTIETEIVRFGGASFNIEHRLFRDDVLGVEGFEKRVLVVRDDNNGGIKSTPFPAEVKALFN